MPPNIVRKGRWSERSRAPGYPDIRGVSSFQGHPIFAGLHQAAYTWTASGNQTCGSCFYEDPVASGRGSRRCSGATVHPTCGTPEDRLRVQPRPGACAHGRCTFLFQESRRPLPPCARTARTQLHHLPSRSTPRGRRTYWNFDSPTVRQVSPLRPVAAVSSKPCNQRRKADLSSSGRLQQRTASTQGGDASSFSEPSGRESQKSGPTRSRSGGRQNRLWGGERAAGLVRQALSSCDRETGVDHANSAWERARSVRQSLPIRFIPVAQSSLKRLETSRSLC